jgi:dTDP-glucose pyrophosphorylase
MCMPTEGVVVAPMGDVTAVKAPSPARVANRPIVCQALGALVSARINEIIVAIPPPALADIRGCIYDDRWRRRIVRYVAQRNRPDLRGSLEAAAAVVSDDPAAVHFADAGWAKRRTGCRYFTPKNRTDFSLKGESRLRRSGA